MEESSKLDNQDISRLSVDSIFFKLNGNFFKKKKKVYVLERAVNA